MGIRVNRKAADVYQHGDLRRALVKAGLKLLSEGGEAGLSLRAAAELAGVSHAAPYRHFRDKHALVAAIAEEGFRLLTQHMREAAAACEPGDPRGRLRALAHGYVAFAVRHPAYFRTIFGGAVCAEGETQPAGLREAGAEAYHVLRDTVAEGIESGALRPGDADELSLAAWSLVHGLSMLIVEGQIPDTRSHPARVKAMTEGMVTLLEVGLRKVRDDAI